ncbi:radical SAM protein [Desulfovibrio sp. TomC]|uniref:radical SAM protein n=1 Tax=Desulfovibrio sp. TomC TaxID=1562888 RepID=UPI0005BA4797|nr:radical SAM protein [Desulfovibrio sp. TomC]
MPGFLCDFLNEVVLLADGHVTTCCLDPLAMNVFGNIYEETFLEIEEKYRHKVAAITQDVLSMPRCRICYDKISSAGFPNTGTYKVDFTHGEQEFFLENKTRIRQLVIEPTCICNLQCNGCMQSRHDISESRDSNFLDLDFVDKWLSASPHSVEAIRLYNYGETFLHTGAIDFIRKTKQKKPSLTIDVATNGLKLDTPQKRINLVRSGVDILYFSIHGGREASIQNYMTNAFSYSKILEIIADLTRLKAIYKTNNPKLVWKYLLFSWNDSADEIKEAMDQAWRVGINDMVFVVPGYPSPSPIFQGKKQLVAALNKQYRRMARGDS